MTTEYRDSHDKLITDKELQFNEEYIKVYIDDTTNSIKRFDTYKNGKVVNVDHYLDTGENEQDVLQELGNDMLLTIINREYRDSYRIEYTKAYLNLEFVYLEDVLYDQYGGILCIQQRNIETNQPVFSETLKKYYDYDYYEEGWGYREILRGTYKEDGSINSLKFFLTDEQQDWETYYNVNFNVLQSLFGEEDISYYQNANFLPPLRPGR